MSVPYINLSFIICTKQILVNKSYVPDFLIGCMWLADVCFVYQLYVDDFLGTCIQSENGEQMISNRQAIMTSAPPQSRLLICRWLGHRLLDHCLRFCTDYIKLSQNLCQRKWNLHESCDLRSLGPIWLVLLLVIDHILQVPGQEQSKSS